MFTYFSNRIGIWNYWLLRERYYWKNGRKPLGARKIANQKTRPQYEHRAKSNPGLKA